MAGVWFGLGGRALVCDTLTCYALYYLRALLSGICVLALDPIVFIRLELDKKGPWYGEIYLEDGHAYLLLKVQVHGQAHHSCANGEGGGW